MGSVTEEEYTRRKAECAQEKRCKKRSSKKQNQKEKREKKVQKEGNYKHHLALGWIRLLTCPSLLRYELINLMPITKRKKETPEDEA